MRRKIEKWIRTNYPTRDEAAWRCREASLALVQAFPALKRVRGHVLVEGRWRPHWWCVLGNETFDPTAVQWDFPVVLYDPLPDDAEEPAGKCVECGNLLFRSAGDETYLCRDCAAATKMENCASALRKLLGVLPEADVWEDQEQARMVRGAVAEAENVLKSYAGKVEGNSGAGEPRGDREPAEQPAAENVPEAGGGSEDRTSGTEGLAEGWGAPDARGVIHHERAFLAAGPVIPEKAGSVSCRLFGIRSVDLWTTDGRYRYLDTCGDGRLTTRDARSDGRLRVRGGDGNNISLHLARDFANTGDMAAVFDALRDLAGQMLKEVQTDA